MDGADRTVTVIGLGNLGAPMASRLLTRGWVVQIVDPVAERRDALLAEGAQTRLDGASASIVCFVTPDETAIHEALDEWLASLLTPNHVVVVHSTILPEAARELGRRIQAETGAGFVEAPVSGGADRARSGDLTIFVGGASDAVDRVEALFRDLGSDVLRMGPIGAGSATKLANQLVLFASTAGIHEALGLTSSYGVEDAAVLRALETGLGDTWAGRHWGFFDRLSTDYDDAGVPPGARPWAKDLREMVEAARAAGSPAPIAAVLAEVVPELIESHARISRLREEQQ